jgi:hypothetical protein
VAYEVIESTPKSHNARVIDLDSETVALLRTHRQQQLVEQGEWGADYENDGLVAAKENGTSIPTRSARRSSGSSRRRPHDPPSRPEAYACDAGLEGGRPGQSRERTPGARVAGVTLKQYAHVIPGMQAAAAALVADLISAEAGGSRRAA